MHNPLILSRARIEAILAQTDAISSMKQAFAAYSAGLATIPPVGEILFPDVDGEAHIKSGHIACDDMFVVKVATGFYRNALSGLPSNSGVMLAFSATTGLLEAILLDEGHLTNLRTAAAGAVAAQLLGPRHVQRIGILGSGVQARLQVQMLKPVTPCRSVLVWARREDAAQCCARDLRTQGFDAAVARTPAEVAAGADLIVTTTPSKAPLLHAHDIRPGTHITAVGSDTPQKQELATDLIARADVLAVDSLVQSRERGELRHALQDDPAIAGKAVELGNILLGRARGRTAPDQVSIADLTGVAVQDIEIAKAVLNAAREEAKA